MGNPILCITCRAQDLVIGSKKREIRLIVISSTKQRSRTSSSSPLYICVYWVFGRAPHVRSAWRGQKRALNTIKLELLVVMSHSVGARNEISPAPCLLFMLFFHRRVLMKKAMSAQLGFIICVYHIINASDTYQIIMELNDFMIPTF